VSESVWVMCSLAAIHQMNCWYKASDCVPLINPSNIIAPQAPASRPDSGCRKTKRLAVAGTMARPGSESSVSCELFPALGEPFPSNGHNIVNPFSCPYRSDRTCITAALSIICRA
jgi:hypothetical protein